MARDLSFLAHIIAALVGVVVLVSMKLTAQAAATGRGQLRLPTGRNWAARLIHLIPLTGFAVLGASQGTNDPISFGQAWIISALVLYFVAASALEMRILPAERELAAAHAKGEALEATTVRAMNRGLDVVLVAIALATIAMLVQWG